MIANKTDKLSSNMEDYLEAIAFLKKDKNVVRVKDISRIMKVKTPSVTAALNILSNNGFVVHERYGYVELTLKGEELAKDVQKRHDMLIEFLNKILNVDYNIAAQDACKIEHVISVETSQRLTKFIEFIRVSKEGGFLNFEINK